MNKTFLKIIFVIASFVALSALAQEPVQLPAPNTEGGKPLMQVLKARRSVRSFSKKPLPPQILSDMLWAAFGINRPESGMRTAPSTKNWQEIDIYVATADGMFLYDAKSNSLKPVLQEDVRKFCGVQPFAKEAAANLVYVADYGRMEEGSDDQKAFFSAADTGFISENVYLFCASEGLVTVIRASIDKSELAKKMNLSPGQHITLSQSVGYPEE